MRRTHEAMTHAIVRVPASTPLMVIARHFSRACESGVSVIDDDGLVIGIVTDRDLACSLGEDLECLGEDAHADDRRTRAGSHPDGLGDLRFGSDPTMDLCAKDVMTATIPAIDGNREVTEAAVEMIRRNVDRLLVTQGGRFVGVITALNVVASLVESESHQPMLRAVAA
jgi:CBS domain-containing protein